MYIKPEFTTPRLLWKGEIDKRESYFLSGVVDIGITNSQQTFATDRLFRAEERVIKTDQPVVVKMPIGRVISKDAYCVGKGFNNDRFEKLTPCPPKVFETLEKGTYACCTVDVSPMRIGIVDVKAVVDLPPAL